MNNRPSPYESAALPLSYTGVPPHGFEPRSPHSKCGILPLDEGGGNRLRGTAAALQKGYARTLRSRRKGKSPGGVGAHPGLSKRSTGGRGVGGPIERSFVRVLLEPDDVVRTVIPLQRYCRSMLYALAERLITAVIKPGNASATANRLNVTIVIMTELPFWWAGASPAS